MFLVRLVRWKQPLRHVRAHNRTNSFFLSARTPWNKYFPFFLFSPLPPLPPACLLFADFCHAIVISCPRTRRAEQSVQTSLSSFHRGIGSDACFRHLSPLPFLNLFKDEFIKPADGDNYPSNNFCQRKRTNNSVFLVRKIYQFGTCVYFKKKNVSIFETYNTHLAVSRNFSIFVVLRKWIEPSIHSWYLYWLIVAFANFAPIQKI